MTRDDILTTVKEALRAVGFDDEARVTAAAGNIAQVWLLEQEYQEQGCALLRQLENVIDDARRRELPTLDASTDTRVRTWLAG
jgi:hypothetical protein